jgi:hypothetical protein
MILWTAAILAALALAWLIGVVAVPVWQLRNYLQTCPQPEPVVNRLGGPHRALWRLRLYTSLPEWIAPAGERAVYVLGWCGPEAMPALMKSLNSPRTAVRELAAAAIACGPLGPQARDAVPALKPALKDPDENLRIRAAQALGAIGPDAKGSVSALQEALGDESQTVRRYAVIALGSIGPDAIGALPVVKRFLTGPAPVLKADAILGVAGITRDGKAVMDAYAGIAGTEARVPDSVFLYEISEEMRGIGAGIEALAPLMEKLLTDKDADVRAYASRVLRRIPGHEGVPVTPFPHGSAPKY